MEDLGFSLESFVEKIQLPHRAKVTEGYYESGDEEGDREFSNGEMLELRRLICPFVDLTFTHPNTKQDSKITVSTRNQDLRFHVITQQKAQGLARPKVFHSVQEVINVWPNSIKSISELVVVNPGSNSGFISLGEELRLIRVIKDDKSENVHLELKASNTKQLVQLPAAFTGSFCEVDDPRSYTLQELVDMARVERFLRLDLSSLEEKTVQVRGLPKDFRGILKMEKPLVFAEIARVLVRETDDEEYTGAPLLAPINCDIKLMPRDTAYMPLPFETCHLSSLGERHAGKLPFVARIIAWTEETAILQNQVTRPGDHLVVYSQASVDKILAHCGDKYFLIPVYHKGCFKQVRTGKKGLKEIKLESLETKPFPFEVQYFNTSEYCNTTDDLLPLEEPLVFDRLVKGEPCVIVSKLFGDVIGSSFHLPLRTKIMIRMERRWKKSATSPQHMSPLDCCSEEISKNLYDEIMSTIEYEILPAPERTRTKKRLLPAVPPRKSQPNSSLANRAQPPLPSTFVYAQENRGRRKDDDEGDSSDDDYSYIDIRSVSLLRSESATEEEINKGVIEIPVNGNISGFSVYQMVFFLRENQSPSKTISAFKKEGIDGLAFARMTDHELKDRGIATPVIQFFRDRSKMQLVLSQL